MNNRIQRPARRLLPGAAAALLSLAGGSAYAQAADAATASSPTEPIPYYVGLSQGFTYDSNVYSVPLGPSDSYSTSSLLGGFDQRLGRQRVFGNANVNVNRYRDQTQLDNTGYNVAAGLDWETLNNLSGNLGVGLIRQLAQPGASSTLPNQVLNVEEIQRVNASARWGGQSLLTLEATLGYSKVDFSAPAYVASDSRAETASLATYYRPGGPLRLGLAARVVDTRSPQAFFDPANGTYQSNTIKSNNLDFLVDYELSGLLTTHARLSYTKQTNSASNGPGYSGLTGSLSLAWIPTGKISLTLDAARNAGLDATPFTANSVVQNGQTVATTAQYQNSQVSDSAGLRLTYSATAKIDAFAGARYVRSRLASTIVDASGNLTGPDTIDSLRTAFLGANYAVARNWNLACSVNRAVRHVSGGAVAYEYNDTTVGCSAQYNLRL
jgi:hypothetical protein